MTGKMHHSQNQDAVMRPAAAKEQEHSHAPDSCFLVSSLGQSDAIHPRSHYGLGFFLFFIHLGRRRGFLTPSACMPEIRADGFQEK